MLPGKCKSGFLMDWLDLRFLPNPVRLEIAISDKRSLDCLVETSWLQILGLANLLSVYFGFKRAWRSRWSSVRLLRRPFHWLISVWVHGGVAGGFKCALIALDIVDEDIIWCQFPEHAKKMWSCDQGKAWSNSLLMDFMVLFVFFLFYNFFTPSSSFSVDLMRFCFLYCLRNSEISPPRIWVAHFRCPWLYMYSSWSSLVVIVIVIIVSIRARQREYCSLFAS